MNNSKYKFFSNSFFYSLSLLRELGSLCQDHSLYEPSHHGWTFQIVIIPRIINPSLVGTGLCFRAIISLGGIWLCFCVAVSKKISLTTKNKSYHLKQYAVFGDSFTSKHSKKNWIKIELAFVNIIFSMLCIETLIPVKFWLKVGKVFCRFRPANGCQTPHWRVKI